MCGKKKQYFLSKPSYLLFKLSLFSPTTLSSNMQLDCRVLIDIQFVGLGF